jgi:putative endonuclease
MKPWSLYLVCCRDGTYYCGISNDVPKRVATHNRGRGAKYTKSRVPVALVYVEEVGTVGQALRRERQVKSLSRSRKKDMIKLWAAARESGGL